MKLKYFLLLISLSIGLIGYGQHLSEPMENAVTVCENLSKAIPNSSMTALKAANELFKSIDFRDFAYLRVEDGSEVDLNGHFLFDGEFVDSLIVNRQVINFSRNYAKKRSRRQRSNQDAVEGSLQLTTLIVKGGEKTVWKTLASGDAEYALVAEPNGSFTMNVLDDKGDRLYVEKEQNKKGALTRRVKLKLPIEKRSVIYLEIFNRGDKESSFALIGKYEN